MLATIAEADYEYAREVGRERPSQCWILSDRDVWYRNPFYCGPVTRHPEDDQYDNEEDEAERLADARRKAKKGFNLEDAEYISRACEAGTYSVR